MHFTSPPSRGASLLGVPRHSEEGRAFYQERVALFSRVAFALSAGFLVLLTAIGAAVSGLGHVVSPAHLAHLASIAIVGVGWFFARRGRIEANVLEMMDAAVLLFACVSFGVMGWLLGDEPDAVYVTTLAITLTTISHAIAVPSRKLRQVVLTGFAVLPPIPLAYVHALRQPPSPMHGPMMDTFVTSLWCASIVCLAVLASRVIYGLHEQVREAESLGQYVLEEKLGEGGMGIVFRATHAMLRRPTAVKLLPPEKAGVSNLARFEREVQLTSGLTHPNIVAIYDYGRTPEGLFYYAMEYLDGVDLERLVEIDGPQPVSRVMYLVDQAASALAEAHANGLIHRDVKPGNMLVGERKTQADVVKVVDFGLVKDLDRSEPVHLTNADVLTGTPLYLAPEAITAPELVDARSDIYALGAVAYFLVTGKNVFEGRTLVEVCGHHIHTPPVPPSKRLGRPLADGVDDVILACLAKDPAARPATATLLRERLATVDCPAWSTDDARGWWTTNRDRVARKRELVTGTTGAAKGATTEAPELHRTIAVDMKGRARA